MYGIGMLWHQSAAIIYYVLRSNSCIILSLWKRLYNSFFKKKTPYIFIYNIEKMIRKYLFFESYYMCDYGE